MGDVAAIADMPPAAFLVDAKVVCAEQLPVAFGHEAGLVGGQPVRQGGSLTHVAAKRVGFSGTDHRADDRPDTSGIFCGCWADQHCLSVLRPSRYIRRPQVTTVIRTEEKPPAETGGKYTGRLHVWETQGPKTPFQLSRVELLRRTAKTCEKTLWGAATSGHGEFPNPAMTTAHIFFALCTMLASAA